MNRITKDKTLKTLEVACKKKVKIIITQRMKNVFGEDINMKKEQWRE
jgi:hypothetical protein